MTLTKWIPQEDQTLWSDLPERARTRAGILLETCTKAAALTNGKRQSFLTEEAQRLGRLHITIGGEFVRLPGSLPSLKRIFRTWNAGSLVNPPRSWKALVDQWDLPDGSKGRDALPRAFVEHWQSLVLNQKRKTKPAHKDLIRAWRNGEKIAGYAELPPEDPMTGVPTGWSYSNLIRREYMPTNFEKVASRIGRAAAVAYRPTLLTTRVGLSVGQYIMFDDMWHDFKVNMTGQRHAQRLLQFHALDLFSGCNFARGMKPVLENYITQAQERLKEAEMLFLVAHVLTCYGYREEGTVLVVEHGTAAIREDFEARIFNCTAGRVRVERSGMEGAATFAGSYAGRGKGNFRFKAALESLGNLIHNETSNILEIPGQTGSNARVNAPEELHGRERHNDMLLRAMAALPPERGALLRLPFLNFHKAVQLVTEIHERINARTDHNLQGWTEAGLLTEEFRLDVGQPWMPATRLLEMPLENRAAVEALIYSKPGLIQSRKFSPAEVFERGRRQLRTLPGHMIPSLMGLELGREVRVDKNQIEFQDSALSPEPLVFVSEITTAEGGQFRLRDGEKFLAYPDLINPTRIYLCDAKGRFVGTAEQWQRVCRADTEALHRQMGRIRKIEADLLAPLAARGAAITRKKIADAQWNAGVLGAKKPLTDAERESNRRIKAEKGDLTDLIPEGRDASEEVTETAAPAESGEISDLY